LWYTAGDEVGPLPPPPSLGVRHGGGGLGLGFRVRVCRGDGSMAGERRGASAGTAPVADWEWPSEAADDNQRKGRRWGASGFLS
jgi:hypothetical protein